LEDIAEQQEVADEIAQAISNPVGFQIDDEDELMAELERLEEVCSLNPFIQNVLFI
jgi:charged multivesicular body protein 4